MTEQEWKPQQTGHPSEGTTSRTGPIIALVGGALMILGALMPWATLSTAFGSVSIPGTEGDGEIILILGVAVAALAAVDLARRWRWSWVAVGICAGLALLIGLIDFSNVTERIQAEDLEGGVASVGAGLYLVLLGAGAAFVGALLSRGRSVK